MSACVRFSAAHGETFRQERRNEERSSAPFLYLLTYKETPNQNHFRCSIRKFSITAPTTWPGKNEKIAGYGISLLLLEHRRPKLTIREIDRINDLCKRMNDLCKRMSDLCKRFEWDVTT